LQPIHIFRAGRHTASNGEAHEFSDERLSAIAAAYDPAKHEAPICIGHPRDNKPAYGWVASLEYRDGDLQARPHQLDADFSELVRGGKYKKVSASFYPAGHLSNPVGDQADYLRHIAFLGAQPPAVKGLTEAQFADDQPEGVIVVEFADIEESIQLGALADTFRRLREWLMRRDGQETADQVVPAYQIESLQRASERELVEPVPEPEPETNASSFEEEEAVSDPSKPAAGAAGDTATPDFAEREAEIQRREKALAERERSARRCELTEFVEQLVANGRVLPRDKANLVEFLEAQDGETELSFADGDQTVKKTGLAWFQGFLSRLPTAVDYSERAGAERETAAASVDFEAPAGYSVDQHRARVHGRAKQIARDKNIAFAEAAVEADRELQEG